MVCQHRLKLLIILLVSYGNVRDAFADDSHTVEASAEGTDHAGDDHPGEPDNGEVMYDAETLLETMSLVQQVLDLTKSQGVQLKEIQGQLQELKNSGCPDHNDDLSFFTKFPWASLLSAFPGAPGYFPQQKRDRASNVGSRPQSPAASYPSQIGPINLRQGNLQGSSIHPENKKKPSGPRPLPTNLKRPPLFPPDTHPPPWIGYRSQHRQLDFGPAPNGPANDPDLSMHNSQNPAPEGVYPPSGGYSEQQFPRGYY